MSRCGKLAVRNLRTAALVAAALMIAASIAIAAEEGADVVRKYPPYPDVWGRVLPFPNLGNGHYYINTEAYERPDGTVYLNIFSGPRQIPGKLDYHTFDFFTGALRDSSHEESLRLEKRTQEKLAGPWLRGRPYRWRSWKVSGKRGPVSEIERVLRFGLLCPYISVEYVDHYYVLRDGKGAVIGERMLLGLFDRPVRIEIRKTCPQRKIRTHFMARWRDIDGGISRLRDGTLLIHGNYPFVIRIKRDFTSPYLAEHDKLFWVDRAVIQKIREKAFRLPGLPLQNANDAVYRYLLNLRKEKTDGK